MAEVEVFAESVVDAKRYVKDMYLSGDSSAELDDATYAVGRIKELDSDGNPIEDDY